MSRDPVHVNKPTVSAREPICCFILNNSERIGERDGNGVRRTVEINERSFFERRSNGRRVTNSHWYVGGIERGSRTCFIVPVHSKMLKLCREL